MFDKVKKLIYSLLLKSQKLTGTDNIYIAKFGSYLTAGNIIGLATAFILSIAFARLPKDIYGDYRYIFSIFGLLSIFSLQGMNNAITQGVAQGYEKTLLTGLKTKLKWSSLGSLASIGIGIYFLANGNNKFAISFLIVAFFLPLFKGWEIYQFYLNGKKLFDKRTIYTVSIQIISTACIVMSLFLTKNLIILILVYFVSYSALRGISLWLVLKKYPPNNQDDSKFISYGKHLSVMQILSIIAQELDSLLLFSFLGPDKLAIYSFAILPVQRFRDPIQGLQELALPKFSVKSTESIKKTLPPKLIKATIIMIILITTYILLAPFFYKIFYPQYSDSIKYSQLYALTLLLFPVSMMLLAIQSQMKTRALYKINTILPIVQIIFLVVFGYFYGIWGFIIAQLASMIFQFLLVYFFFRRM